MSSSYHFVTRWSFDASIDAVWNEISRPDAWPTWWRGVVSVELVDPGDEDGVGAYRRMTWRSVLPYRLQFNIRTVYIDRPRMMEGRADGELYGVGRWTLAPTTSGTTVEYDWRVEATKPWMRRLAPIARLLFKWNHDVVMRWGHEGLERRLRATRLPSGARA